MIQDKGPGGCAQKQSRSRIGSHEDRHASDKQSTNGGNTAKNRIERTTRAMANGHADFVGRTLAQ